MRPMQIGLIVLVAFAAGMIGGFLSRYIAQPPHAVAQLKVEPTTQPGGKKVVAEVNELRVRGFDGKTNLLIEPDMMRWEKPGDWLAMSPGLLNMIGFAPSIRLGHGSGSVNVWMAALSDGSSMISLDGKTGKSRIVLRVTKNDEPSITLFDKDGVVRAVLGCVDLEKTTMGDTSSRSPASLVFFDKHGKVVWKAP